MIYDRIKFLREQRGMTQQELAKQLHVTRSSVNAWELGISIPSAQSLIDLSNILGVSTDVILGLEHGPSIDVSGLTEKDIQLVYSLINHLRNRE